MVAIMTMIGLAGVQVAIASDEAVSVSTKFTHDSFVDLQEFYFEGGNVWRQTNDSHQAGDDSTPEAWVQIFEWGPARDSVIVRSYAQQESGSCDLIFVGIRQFKPSSGIIDTLQIGATGLQFKGQSWLDESGFVLTNATGMLPNGSELIIRDRTDISETNVYRSNGELWNDELERWDATDTVEWVRVEEHSPCGQRIVGTDIAPG